MRDQLNQGKNLTNPFTQKSNRKFFQGGERKFMKKNKIIASFLVLALIVTLVAPSFALAATPDTSNIADAKTKAAADKLVALGVFVGDDNGDLGIEDNFTRAQFATVISRIAGFENAAKALGNQATGFSDVPANHWGSGYIAAATARGYLKGDTAGTFRPDADISYAEALTVLMRILGYKDEFLPGTWPANFMVAGDQVGLIGDDFVANVAIARGAIMKLTSEVIEKDIVAWDDKKLMFVEVKDSSDAKISLLSKNFADKTETKVLKNVDTKDKKVVFTVGEMKFAEGFNGAGLNALRGHEVTVIKNDENQVVGIADAQAANKMVTGKAAAANSASAIKIDTITYTIPTSGAIVYKNGTEDTTNVSSSTVTVAKDDAVTIFFNDKAKKNENITFVIIESFTKNVFVKSVGDVNSDGEGTIELDNGSDIKVNKNTVYTVNGNEATLADIKKNFVLDYVQGATFVTKVVAYDKAVEGKVTSLKVKDGKDTVTVNGANYEAVSGSLGVSLDKEFTLYLNGANKVVKAKPVEGTSDKFKGLVVSIEGYDYMNNNKVEAVVDVTVLTEDGNVVTYQIDKDKVNAAANKGFKTALSAASGNITVGGVVSFELNKNKIVTSAAINTITNGAVTTALKATDKVIKIGSANYALANDVVVFSLSGDKQFKNNATSGGFAAAFDPEKVKSADLKIGALTDVKKSADVVLYQDTNGLVKYIAMYKNGTETDDQLQPVYGVFKEYYTVKETDKDEVKYFVLNVNGQDVTYKAATTKGAVVAGDLIALYDGSKDGTFDATATAVVYNSPTLQSNNTKLNMNGTIYVLNSDTKYVTVTMDGAKIDSIGTAVKNDVTGKDVEVVSVRDKDGNEILVNGSEKIASVVVIKKQK